MKEEIQSIISNKKITTVFQPIFDIENEVIIGYEALTRGPEKSPLHSPELLFQAAEAYNLQSELDLICRASAIYRFVELRLTGKLFINICLNVMLNKDHPHGETIKLVEHSGLSPKQVVIEISEKSPFPNNDILLKALNKYRQFGFDIAIDDVGAGYSGLKQWSCLRPDIVKIDRYFIEQCDQDLMKREFLKILFELGRISNAQIIAEGIETKAEFELLRELGMVYSQGFFLAKPNENPTRTFPSLDVSTYPEVESRLGTVAALVTSTITIKHNQSVNDAYDIFIQHPNTQAISVLDEAKPLGLIYRHQLLKLYVEMDECTQFTKKLAMDVMFDDAIIIEQTMPLEKISALLTAKKRTEFNHLSMVTNKGNYVGVVSPFDILKAITDSILDAKKQSADNLLFCKKQSINNSCSHLSKTPASLKTNAA